MQRRRWTLLIGEKEPLLFYSPEMDEKEFLRGGAGLNFDDRGTRFSFLRRWGDSGTSGTDHHATFSADHSSFIQIVDIHSGLKTN
jgi:hypothetical protein